MNYVELSLSTSRIRYNDYISIILLIFNTSYKFLNKDSMKKVEAVIRKSRFEEVKKALHEVDIDFFTFWDVTGVGKEKEGHIFRGAIYEANRIQRRVFFLLLYVIKI